MTIQILRMPALTKKVGLSHDAIYDSIARGTFPRQIKIAPQASGWVESEVDTWLESKIAERDALVEQKQLERDIIVKEMAEREVA